MLFRSLLAGHAPQGKRGRPPFAVSTMLRIHFMQQWFGLSDPAMEEALHDTPIFRNFAQLDWGSEGQVLTIKPLPNFIIKKT